MWYLYLDESGDLGFDFVNKKPSKFFTVTIVAVQGQEMNRRLAKEVKLVLRRKLNPKNKRSRLVEELKGERTTSAIKKYFYERVKNIPFGIYNSSTAVFHSARLLLSTTKTQSRLPDCK